jgi:hypothetical protein
MFIILLKKVILNFMEKSGPRYLMLEKSWWRLCLERILLIGLMRLRLLDIGFIKILRNSNLIKKNNIDQRG